MQNKDSMTRTQIYLSKAQEQALKTLALTSGTKQSELIRNAIDMFLQSSNANQAGWKTSLSAMRGIWTHDDACEDRMASIRSELDR
ncbi:MAG: CopG family transcriptional regulator [Pseudomonadota bacterium]